jgi:hypothetical protein
MRVTRGQVRSFLRWCVLALGLVATAAQAVTQDITAQFSVTRSGLVFNRTTNTFDSSVTIRNTSTAPVLAPIAAVVGGLPPTVTLANKAGDMPDGRPFASPMQVGAMLQSGGTLSFVLKFSNPQRIAFTSTLQILYSFQVPADAPSLIGVVATGGTNAGLIGRVDGLPNRSITLQVLAARTCVYGTLVGAASVAGAVSATTDAGGYFSASVAGVNPGDFVAIKLTAPGVTPLSLCQVSARDNDSWPKAFALAGAAPTATDFIDAPGKARWFKFSIAPGQRIQLTLSGLPADYDLAVFKDIAQVFASQFNPTTATPDDLVRLAAEYAPSVFSPSVFSPSVFSPDAYAPSVFSPSVFSPSVFSPSVFSPSVFSPSVFSPSVFSPSVFSPSVFSPSVFSPSVFSPSVFSTEQIAQAFSTSQTRSVIAIAATPGIGSESTIVNSWNSTGDFYVRITGRNGAFNTSTPFVLNVVKGATTCAGVTDTAVTPRSAVASTGLKTVFLTDSSTTPMDEPLPLPGGPLRKKLTDFASRTDVSGVIVDVAGDARVAALKQQAANNPACPFAKNLVAEEIKRIVDTYRANPLRYVVIVGNDQAIPFFRSPDQSMLGQESGFVPPVQSNSPSEASLRRDFVLSQDAYGAKAKLSMTVSDFPVPGLAVGRLVETPTEIAGIIDAYVAANGVVVPGSSLVTGYDFLEDAANAVRTELQLGTARSVDTLVTPNGKSPQDPASWTATQLGQKLLGSRHDVIFLAGHFSANSALAADFKTNLLTTDLAASTVDLTNAIVFSAGCHSGFNLVDVDAIPGVTLPLDWAQAFARKKATLIAGTGYQYGDTDFLEYSERLYRNFARNLRAGTGAIAIGEALVQAKLDYLAATPDIRGIHEKALLQATLFGLPMLGVNMPAGRGAVPGNVGVITPSAAPSGPAASLGLRSHDLHLTPSLTPRTLALKNVSGGPNVTASWLSGTEGVMTKPGEPALPLAAVNVTPTDRSVVLRGVGFRGGTYVDSAPLLPFSGAPTTELRGVHVPFVSPVFYPGRLWTPNYFGALSGNGGTQLLVTPAQHRVASIAGGTSTQRRYTALDLRLFYSGNLSKAALSEAPSIVGIEEAKEGSDVVFTAEVVGDPAAAIHQVWVTYTSDTIKNWTSLDLAQCVAPLPPACGTTADSRLWKGRLVSAPSTLKYMVQAVSGIGLVALDDNRGNYYGIGALAPAATTVELVSPPTTAAIGDRVNVKVKLTFGGTPLAGKIVTIALGGTAQVAATATDGTVTVNMPVTTVPGSYPITVSFDGDDGFLASSATASFQVTKATAALAGLSPLGATLTGVLGGKTQALQAEPVSFAVTGPSGATTIWANTNNLGQATLPPPGLPAGTYSITGASFGGNATFAATSVAFSPAQQFTVAKTAQSISFGTLPNVSFGAHAFEAYAIATSGLPVTFSASGPCSVANNLVHLNGIGNCVITANQFGDALYAAATPEARTFAISKANQAITFAPAPIGVRVGQPLVTVSASSASSSAAPSAIPIAYSSLTPSTCTLGGGGIVIVNLLAPGTCTIAANQAGDALYNAAAQATQSFAVAPAGTPPTTFTVTNLNNSGPGSLRQAIIDANAAPGPDIIQFGVTGTIVMSGGAMQIAGPLSIVGPGSANLTIDGNLTNRIFTIGVNFPACPAADPSDYLVSISGVRLINGRRTAFDSGGGTIYTDHSLLLDDVTIQNGIARGGGGVWFAAMYPGQMLSISNSRFFDNVATDLFPTGSPNASGGALYVVERCPNATDTPHTDLVSVTIANSEFRRNSSRPNNIDGRGGAIRSYSLADILITDTIIEDNHVDAPSSPLPLQLFRGGGYEGASKSLRIERSEIANNGVNDVTGSDASRSGGLHLYNTSVDRQSPEKAMAIKIVNSTISGNFSSASGGAMQAGGNIILELINTTVSDNQAAPTRRGGITMTGLQDTYPISSSLTARPTLRLVSSILANSTGSDLGYGTDTMPTFTVEATNSLIEQPCTVCTLFVTGTGNVIGVDPLLGPLGSNGGPTRSHALLPGSIAINAGSNPLGLTTDQRGTGFPRVSGPATDMGAYESP